MSDLEDFVQRTVDELNKIEPFAVRFERHGEDVVIPTASAVHLIGWINRYENRMRATLAQLNDLKQLRCDFDCDGCHE